MTKKKKGLSTIVVTLMLILLTLFAVGIVWMIVKDIIKGPIENVESCFGSFDKVKINSQYTCYNASSKEFQFSIDIKDIEVDELLVSVSSSAAAKSFRISSTASAYDYLREYAGNYGGELTLPEKNAGLTYILNTIELGIGVPTSMEIAPIINEEQCSSSDSLTVIDSCILLS